MPMSQGTTSDSLKYYLTATAVAARPTTWTVSLHTGDPGVAGTANEVTDSAYARQSIAFSVVGQVASNTATVTFPAAVLAYNVTHVVVWGGSSPQVIQALRTTKSIAPGVQATIAAGELTVGGSA